MGRLAGLLNQFGDVEESLGRNTSPVQAHPARLRILIHQNDLHPMVRSLERRWIPTGPATKDNELSMSRGSGHEVHPE